MKCARAGFSLPHARWNYKDDKVEVLISFKDLPKTKPALLKNV
jgi:hypothetical protein